ncbi:MAG: ribonuclease H family protein [Bacteroidia bacterium]
MKQGDIQIYTDGSCHTQQLVGAWAAIIIINDIEVILQDFENNTTHHRMELKAVINALEYVISEGFGNTAVHVISDSQYVVDLITRKEKLKQRNFITNKGTVIRNDDLVKKLINLIEQYNPAFTKVKSHDVNGDKVNRRVDMLARQLVRQKIDEYAK